MVLLTPEMEREIFGEPKKPVPKDELYEKHRIKYERARRKCVLTFEKFLELAVQDASLTKIAEVAGIERQAVSQLIKTHFDPLVERENGVSWTSKRALHGS